MDREQIIRMTREAGGFDATPEFLERFAALVAAAEREKVAAWMIERSYATGHGDTVEDLLKELEWRARESEREACAKVCEEYGVGCFNNDDIICDVCADLIRARGRV